MSYGLEVSNSAGQVVLTVDSRLARYVDSYTIPTIAARSTVNISVPGYSTDGTWFIFIRGSILWLGITEITDYIQVFNSNFFGSYTSAAVIEVFRG